MLRYPRFLTIQDNQMFKYQLGQKAIIKASGEHGEIIGRAEYAESENMYQIRYQAADGRAVENWWSVSAIQSVEEAKKEVEKDLAKGVASFVIKSGFPFSGMGNHRL